MISGVGVWPKAANVEHFHRNFGGRIPEGLLHTVVPAAPSIWITALARFGTMSFSEVAAAAIRFARDGFPTYPFLAEQLDARQNDFSQWPGTATVFLPGGRPPEVGEIFVQSDLGRTLQYMADEERAHANGDRLAGLKAARDAFYRGDIAREIVAFHKREGGLLSEADLAEYRSRLEPAVRRFWRGHEVMVCGPWCQGPALLEALLLTEQIGITGLQHNSAAYLHVITEALKLAFSDRERYFGDPQFIHVPLDFLLSPETIARRAREFDRTRACPEMPAPIDAPTAHHEPTRTGLPRVEADTSYACAVDRWGNAFSATPSDGSWASPVIPGLGIIPSSRGSQNRPDPKHPMGVAPGKRPRLTPNPAMLVSPDGAVMPFGTPGGDVQTQAMLQVLLNILHFGMELQDAIEAPRVATYSFPSSFAPFEYFPGRLAVEGRLPANVRDDLARLGHEVSVWPDWTWLAGSVEAIRTNPANGLIAAGADPRRPAYAAAI